jgi:hypothetical protein
VDGESEWVAPRLAEDEATLVEGGRLTATECEGPLEQVVGMISKEW